VTARDATILGLERQVKFLARRQKNLTPAAELEDLLASAWVGAIQAVDSFDPARKVTLAVFANHRIRGAMLDFLRELDPLSRDHRLEIKRGAPNVSTVSLFLVLPNGQEIPRSVPYTDPAFGAINSEVDCRAIEKRATAACRTRRTLGRNMRIVRRYMAGGETMLEIAGSEGINESRVSQIIKDGIRTLRKAA
jgi:RNA polymerase sigma factor (sigma-70 family)